MHIAHRFQHHLGYMIKENEWKYQTVYQKIARGIGGYISTSTQPIRQISMNADTEKRNKNAERHTANQRMTKHLTGICKIISSDKMSYLY